MATSDACSDTRLATAVQPKGPLHDSDTRDEYKDPVDTSENDGCKPVSRCDACSFCNDTCGDPQCPSCSSKLKSSSAVNESEMYIFPCIKVCPDKEYTMCQLRRHCTAESAWLLVGNTIYDATSYIASHPGGTNSILKKSGGVCDCTEDMNFHSRNARQIWKKYKVGKLRRCMAGTDSFGAGEQCVIS